MSALGWRFDQPHGEPDGCERQAGLDELGLDSLGGFELKNRIESELAITLPVGKFLQQPTLTDLTAAILERLGREAGGPASV